MAGLFEVVFAGERESKETRLPEDGEAGVPPDVVDLGVPIDRVEEVRAKAGWEVRELSLRE